MLRSTIVSMRALFLAMSLLFIGNILLVSSAAIVLKGMNVGEFMIGLIASFYFLGALISTISSHKIVSGVGHIRSFGIFSSLFGAVSILHLSSDSPYVWLILRFFLGYCYYGLLMVIESWLNQQSKNEIRSRVLSVYGVIFQMSSGAGVLLLSMNLSTQDIFIASIVFLMLCAIPLNLMRIKEPAVPKSLSISIPKVFSVSALAFMTSFIGGMLVNGFLSMSSVFILLLDGGVKGVSAFMFSGIAGGFVVNSVIGGVSDRFGRKVAILYCSLLSLAASILMLFFVNIFLLSLFAFFFGGGIFCLYSLALARANDRARNAEETIETGRSLLFIYSLGSFLAPLTLGAMMKYFNSYGFVIFCIILLFTLSVHAFTQPIIPKEDRKDFKQHLATTVDKFTD